MPASVDRVRTHVNLSEVLQTYVAGLHSRAKRSSIKTAHVHAATLERYFGETFNAAALGLQDLEGFCRWRLESVSRASVNGALGVLRSALRYGVDTGMLLALPVRIRKLREGTRLPRVLEPSQVQDLVFKARPPFDIMLMLAARAGLRHAEILHLQVGDVDLRRGMVRVSAKPEWCPKSHHEREVPLARALGARLGDWIEALNDKSPTAWLFVGHEGTPRKEVCLQIKEIFQAAGLYEPAAKPGLHALRRTWATELLSRGADIETVRQLGGWSSLAVVQRYITSSDERKRNAIESLEG
jgi:integrase/recombinase XerC